jgi:chemosensory pili system protein ChpC
MMTEQTEAATQSEILAALDLSTLLLPVTGQLLVVPSAVVAEIIKRRELSRPESGPEWLLGTLQWHGVAVPVVSFEAMNGEATPDPGSCSRIVILSTITDGVSIRHYAMLTQGVPHLLRLTPESIEALDDEPVGPAECLKARIFGQFAAIPDFDYIEGLIGGAAAG